MFFYLAELKAFLTSKVTTRRYFLLSPFHRFPDIASFPLPTTWLIVSSVFPDESRIIGDRMTVHPVVCCPWARVQVSAASIARGRFPLRGMCVLYMSRNVSGIALTAVFNATFGMLSIPDALLFPIFLFSRSDSSRVLSFLFHLIAEGFLLREQSAHNLFELLGACGLLP